MINKNFKCLKRSPRQIARELDISPTTANDYIKENELFKKSFGADSFYEKVEEENRRKRKGKMNDKANIRYKIKLSIYHLMKMCIKNFRMLSHMQKRYLKQIEKKEYTPLTGSEILEYNRQVLNDMFSKESFLQDFQKNMLKKHESVKYAATMDVYYSRFLDDISILTTLGIDGSVTDNPGKFSETIANLEEIIWLFTLNRAIGRDTDNPNQFNINNALHDVICEIEKYNDEKDVDYIERQSEKITKEEYNKKLKKLEQQYFERVKKHLKEKLDVNINLDTDTCKFYAALEESELFGDAYQEKYIYFFQEYITTNNKFGAMKRLIWNCTDIYGRMFVPHLIKEADDVLNILNYMISHIKANSSVKLSEISGNNIDLLKQHFIYINTNGDTYDFYAISYINEKPQSVKYNGNTLKEVFGEASQKEAISLILDFSNFLCFRKTVITLTIAEADMLDKYFKYCTFNIITATYFNKIEVVKHKLMQIKETLSSSKSLYPDIKNNIDASIAVKWADSIFKDC